MSNLDFTQVELKNVITHQVGNKLRDEKYRLSDADSSISNDSREYLLKYFLTSAKADELFSFFHPVDREMNEVFAIVSKMFTQPNMFVQHSQDIAKLLYESSMHPKIKEGQLNVAYLSDAVIDGEIVDAIGVFKSENDSPFIQMRQQDTHFSIVHEFGFDLKEMDKGCLIFNSDRDHGFKVVIIDRLNRSIEAQYWKDDFLGVQPKKDEYHQTNQFLGITKQFVTKQLSEDFEVSKADQIDFLNRSVDYFKKHETFDKSEFEEEVFGDNNVIESFRKFDQGYRQDNELDLSDNFQISSQAVKKQSRIFKSVLKLDKNFDIYIHGDKNLIEKGIENDGRKYYKIYYEEEK